MDNGKQMTEGERLMAEMAAKYGGAVAAAPRAQQPQPAPAAAPQQAQQKPQDKGFMGGIKGILGGRAAQIDKAAGYACGGKIKAHSIGGKISGPGTATSDSIEATVRESGEKVLVSDKERVLSVAQDKLLEGMAQKAGFESLDAMLEAGTGMPVGPTMKDGKRAASEGGKFVNGVWIPAKPTVPGVPMTVDVPKVPANSTPPSIAGNAQAPQPGIRAGQNIPESVGKPQHPVLAGGAQPTIYGNGGIPSASTQLQVTADKIPVPAKPAMPSMVGGIPAEPNIHPVPAVAAAAPVVAPPSPATHPQAPAQPASIPSGPTVADSAGGIYTPEKGYNPGAAIVNMFKDSAQAARTGVHYDDVKASREANTTTAAQPNPIADGAAPGSFKSDPFGQKPGLSVQSDTPAGQSFMTGATPGAAPAPAVQRGRDANGVITADSVKSLYDDNGGIAGMKSGSFHGSIDMKGGNDILARSLGYGSAAEFMAKQNAPAPGAGQPPGPRPDEPEPQWKKDERENAEKSRRWAIEDGMKNMRSPRRRAEYIKGMAAIDAQIRGQDIAAETSKSGTEATTQATIYGHNVNAERAKGHDAVIARGQDISGMNDAARNSILADQAKAGKLQAPIAVSGGEVADPSDPMGQRKLKMPNSVFDPNTGKWHSQPQAGPAAGKAPDSAIAMLKSDPKRYGAAFKEKYGYLPEGM